jgi:hypothetical protein
MWKFPGGGTLRLGFLERFDDVFQYQGQEYQWLAFDELTQWEDQDSYMWLWSRLRSPFGVPLRRINTTNPGGPGHFWVMKRWAIDDHPEGGHPIIEKIVTPQGTEKTRSRIFIPGRLKDNRFLYTSGDYAANLMILPEIQRKMYLDGRWDVIEGAFFTEWNPAVHICESFPIPEGWDRWMCADWGTADPYCFLWLAESPAGEMYVYREMYGLEVDRRTGEGKPNKGSREPASLVAQKVRKIEADHKEWILERWMDRSCFDTTGHEVTIAQEFAKQGVHFRPAHKANKVGAINRLRELLKVVNGMSRLRVMRSCKNLIRTLPMLQVDPKYPEQYDTKGEDHAVDALIYGTRRNVADIDNQQRSKLLGFNTRRAARMASPYGAH